MAQNQKTEAPPANLDEYLAWVQSLAASRTNLLPVTENLLREKFALQDAVGQLRATQ